MKELVYLARVSLGREPQGQVRGTWRPETEVDRKDEVEEPPIHEAGPDRAAPPGSPRGARPFLSLREGSFLRTACRAAPVPQSSAFLELDPGC